MTRLRLITLSLLATALLMLVACANLGSPDGGAYDETPPRVVRTTPKFGMANADNVKKIVIEFDELIKVENAYEKVVISPPQIEQPEIETSGRKVSITLLDSLKANTTYTIDFADAIVDNNEGNPYGDYAFTFSTGPTVDTLQVSGHVLDASNLEPIKGMLVGLYRVGNDSTAQDSATTALSDSAAASLPDSIFRTKPFERISRTDSRGHFVVKGIAPGRYRIFALGDQNQNFIYDQPAEQIAFTEMEIEPSCRPDVRADTIWHDSIHYDSVMMTPYTHYLPDDIALRAFTTTRQDRHLLKRERLVLQQFSLFFTAPSDTLPRLTGLNFDSTDAFIVDASEKNDTINYWIKDSLIYNIDTLQIQIDFYETDTIGQLVITTDTLELTPKLSKARLAQREKERYENWVKEYKQKMKEERRAARRAAEQEEDKNEEKTSKRKKRSDDEVKDSIPPMPEEFLEYKIVGTQSLDPERNIDFVFSEPLDSFDLSKIHLAIKIDSLFVPTRFLFRPVAGKLMHYRLYAEWEPDSTYQIEIDTAAFVNIYGKRCEAQKRVVKLKSIESYATLFLSLQGDLPNAYVELLDGSDKVVKRIKVKDGKADFYFLSPSTYYLRMFCDLNDNGQWDTGDYDTHLQPEPLYYFPKALAMKANWEFNETWNPTSIPLSQQKPLKITKQKPDKAKTIQRRNASR